MDFRLSNLKIDKILGVDFIDETTNQVIGHWSNLETLPEKEEEILVEVKSNHFLPLVRIGSILAQKQEHRKENINE